MTNLVLLACLVLQADAKPGALDLEELDLGAMSAGWGRPRKNLSVTGQPLAIAGERFARGIGTHAESDFTLRLDGKATRLTAAVGVDDDAGDARASIEFFVYGDDRELWRSGPCRWKEKARRCDVDLAGVSIVELVVTNGGDGIDFDHADWCEPTLTYAGAPPLVEKPEPEVDDHALLTPPPPPFPELHGPLVVGARPGHPFLQRIPCTGERPLEFAAEGLPAGITLDGKLGILRGTTPAAGRYRVKLSARNRHGASARTLEIVAGETLALTPPMGWNSWYIHYAGVKERHLREAAEQMVASGMADFGYCYVNVDDGWMVAPGSKDPELGGPAREQDGSIRPNGRFPDLRGMVEAIHALGLKAGIYTSPGPRTCAGFEGSFGHEAIDATTFAAWGIDFLKYDWCSYDEKAGGRTLADLQRPYRLMADELEKQPRDLVFNLCQYGMGDVWKWGGEFGNCWRTTGDLGNERGGRLPGFYAIGLSNARHHPYARPGAWNDPDYLLFGRVGDGRGGSVPTTLTSNEQYSYMAMWCLMAAPLIFSGDMAHLDPFTLNVLCNAELIDVDQDPLGRQAAIVRETWRELVLSKELDGGARAVGLFNLGERPAKLAVSWKELGLAGPRRVRDLWRQVDLESGADGVSTTVPRHGVAALRIAPAPADAHR
jgi:alpha-galactosidase